ncbi:MAG TPA: hypothetical protein VIO57_10895 [Chloroflexota bacterium]
MWPNYDRRTLPVAILSGVRTVTVAGLPEQPVVRTAAADVLEVTAAGVTATVRQARLETQRRLS